MPLLRLARCYRHFADVSAVYMCVWKGSKRKRTVFQVSFESRIMLNLTFFFCVSGPQPTPVCGGRGPRVFLFFFFFENKRTFTCDIFPFLFWFHIFIHLVDGVVIVLFQYTFDSASEDGLVVQVAFLVIFVPFFCYVYHCSGRRVDWGSYVVHNIMQFQQFYCRYYLSVLAVYFADLRCEYGKCGKEVMLFRM